MLKGKSDFWTHPLLLLAYINYIMMGFIMAFLPLNFDHITPITLLSPPTFLPLQFFVVVLTQCISLRLLRVLE